VAEDRDPQPYSDETFWREMFALRGSVTPYVARRVLVFGIVALVIFYVEHTTRLQLPSDLGPYEVAGAVLGLLLVFRTNAGYDRWYEGRKLMGQLVNHSRNLAVTALVHGPADPAWRETVIHWIAAYAHVSRAALRGQRVPGQVRFLLGDAWADEVDRAEHMPSFVALRIGELLRHACDHMGMDRQGFLEADRERMVLVESEGACERIRATPVPKSYSVNIRRLVFLYLFAVPFALVDRVGWLTPLITMLIAYPVLAVDQLGVELQQPFAIKSLDHLPLEQLTDMIERNVLGLLRASQHTVTGPRDE
jgi:putative membrane protein